MFQPLKRRDLLTEQGVPGIITHSLSQQNDVTQDTEHLIESRSLIHPLDDGVHQLCNGVDW